MRAAGLLALLLTVCLLPAASAQVPEPAEAVALACATVGGVDPAARELLPVCEQAEPQSSAPAEEDAAAAAPAPPATPQDAEALAQEVLEEVQRIPQDPAGAPERLLAIVATLVQFVRDLIGIPGAIGAHMGASLADARDAAEALADAASTGAADAARATGEGIAKAARATAVAVAALVDVLRPDTASGARGTVAREVPVAGDAVEGLLGLPLRELREPLAG
jgi:hypothetical protein